MTKKRHLYDIYMTFEQNKRIYAIIIYRSRYFTKIAYKNDRRTIVGTLFGRPLIEF